MSSRTEQIYRARIARVVAHIVAQPLAEHRLDALAAMVHFSPHHFHRIYRSIVGETLAATVRRVRLARAARLLEAGASSITQVALTVGYESPQAFTRAFGQFAGQTPSGFQRQMQDVILSPSDTPLAVQIVKRPVQRAHGLRHHGPAATIAHTQRQLQLYPSARNAVQWLGLSHGDPEDEDNFHYYAAMALSDARPDDSAGLEVFDIPAGCYACHRLVGPYTRINAAITTLYSRWLPRSGYEPDDRPTLEHYLDSSRDTAPADLRTDLLIPVRPARAS
ncbi:MAG: GyrI-like domain-containing protein [Xenophilus sp.]